MAVRKKDEDEITEWVKCCLTSVVSINHMANDDIMWQSMQGRENVATDYEALRCTPLMRILNFGAFKSRTEAAGKTSVYDLVVKYKQHLDLSARSEKITASWVDLACTFLNRMYTIPGVAKLLTDADDLPAGANPLEGTSKLQAIIQKARTPDKILKVVEHVLDAHKAGFLPTPPPCAAFYGQTPGSHGKGLVDLILFKWDVAYYIFHDWVQTHPFPAEALVEMKTVLSSIKSYRAKCGYPNDKNDMTFRAGWRNSCEELFVFVEGVLFDSMYDGHLKEALKCNASASDVVAAQFNELLEPIADRAKEEAKDRGANLHARTVAISHSYPFTSCALRMLAKLPLPIGGGWGPSEPDTGFIYH